MAGEAERAFAAGVSDILKNKGRALGNAQAQSGAIWGNTLATLGDRIPREVQEAMRVRAEQRKQAQIQQVFQDAGGDVEKALPQIMALDPELGQRFGEEVYKSKKLAYDFQSLQWEHDQKRLEMAMNALGSAQNDSDWAVGVKALHDAGADVSQIPPQFSPEARDAVNLRMLDAKDRLAATKPKPPEAPKLERVDTVDAQGRAVTQFVTPTEGASYQKPTGTQAANAPNIGSFEDFVIRKFGPNPTDAQILEARKVYGQADDRAVTVNVPGGTANDPRDIAEAIISGDQPPTLQGLYRYGAPVRAELARRGYNLTDAQADWQAIQRHISSLNGTQQLRLRQATEFVRETVPLVRELSADVSKALPRSAYPVLNKAALAAAQNGVLGAAAQQAATKLSAQIADMQSELAVMYRGGNASTDEALKKAADMLRANWSEPQLKAALDLIEKNSTIRLNSIRNTGVASLGATNQYAPAAPAPAAPAAPASPAGLSYQDYLKSRGQK